MSLVYAWHVWARNYFWPALFAVLGAVAALIARTLEGGQPLDFPAIGTAALAALAAWFLTRFHPTAGPDQPALAPKVPPRGEGGRPDTVIEAIKR